MLAIEHEGMATYVEQLVLMESLPPLPSPYPSLHFPPLLSPPSSPPLSSPPHAGCEKQPRLWIRPPRVTRDLPIPSLVSPLTSPCSPLASWTLSQREFPIPLVLDMDNYKFNRLYKKTADTFEKLRVRIFPLHSILSIILWNPFRNWKEE